ncbi:MAG: B12-binding domain-containing radical SAM protein [Phycisphaerae bacterium]
MNILLLSPRTPKTFWSFCHVMPFISRKAAFPPLGLLTVAAMLPRDWKLRLIDLNIEELDHAAIAQADFVFVSGMLVHFESAREVIERAAACGKTVIAGGPLFTSGRERFPSLRHVAIGEAEELMPSIVADMRAGTLQPEYRSSTRPDITQTPVPRWDLLRLRQYATMPIQYSRGCPFDCEFCDIVAIYGRTPRVKNPAQVVAELDALVAAGWNGGVFVVDDNFIGNRARVKDLLRALIEWRKRRRSQISFLTEASLNLVDDEELLDLMVAAGFKRVFVGIESPAEESLAECGKVQNKSRDMVAAVRKMHRSGIEVMGGFIVGFDSDPSDIFQRQLQFIRQSGVVTAMVGLLTALPGTRLFKRLSGEGRIIGHSTGNNVDVDLNFVPKLDRETLLAGYRSLVKHLYTPREYYRRVLTFLRDYRPSGPKLPPRWNEIAAFFRSLWVLGVASPGRREYWKFLARTLLLHRAAFAEAMSLAIMGHHFRRVASAM